MLENPVKYYLENTYEDLSEFNQLIENVADIYSKDTTKTERTFNVFDSIRNIISEWPVEFVLSSVVMTDENGSTGKIPYSVNVTHGTEDRYQGVNDMTDCALAFMNIGVHELLRPLTYADIFGIYDNEEIYKNSIKTIHAKEDELKAFNAKSTNSNVTWNAYVVKNADTKKVRSLFSAEEIGYKLACDGKNATFENGVLTFNGPALINFEAFNPGVYTLVIENDDDYKRTYEIVVSEKHECVAGDTECLLAPSDETLGLSVSYCSICGSEMNLKLIDANECESHSFSEPIALVKETCGNEGMSRKQCFNCGYTVIETVAKLAHTSDNGTITRNPTCSSYGEKVYKCNVCKAILKSEKIEKISHNYKSELILPKCAEKGYTLHTCVDCGDNFKDNFTDATGHSESTWIVDKNPDCVNEGIMYIECTVCGKILEFMSVPATGHIDSDKDDVCDYCGKKISAPDPSDPSKDCTCICHKTGFMGFIYKIIRIFWKLFKINKYCSCGQAHY